MSISFINYSSHTGSASEPTGAANGDLLIGTFYQSNPITDWGPADTTNWHFVFTSYDSANAVMLVYWTLKQGSVNYTLSDFLGNGSYSTEVVTIYCFRGVGSITQADGAFYTFTRAYNTSYNNSLLFSAVVENSSTTITAPSGMTATGPVSHPTLAAYQIIASPTSSSITFGGGSSPQGIAVITATPNDASVSSTSTVYTNVSASTAGAVNKTITATSSVTAFVVKANVISTITEINTITATQSLAGLQSTVSTPSTSASTVVTAQANINPVKPKIELSFNSVWTDVSPNVLYRSGISITRGRRDESSVSDVSNCLFDLKNPTGLFSPLNPNSAYYPYVNMNTPGRVWTPDTISKLVVPADDNNTYGPYSFTLTPTLSIGGIQCVTSSGLQISGNIELQFDGNIDDWGPTNYNIILIDKLYYGLKLVSGSVVIYWTPDGSSFPVATSTVPLPKPWHGRKAIRATMQINVSGNWNVNYYYAKSFADAQANGWTQLGTTVVGSGTTSIGASSDNLIVGGSFLGKVYAINVYSGLSTSGGTLVANPDFTSQLDNTTSFNDSSGNTWIIFGSAEIHRRMHRTHGVLPSWPLDWDKTGRDVYSQVTLSGVIRRISQGVALRSAFYRAMTKTTPVHAINYWPCEDAVGSTQLTPNIGSTPLLFNGTPTLSSDSSFDCSAPIVVSNTATIFTKLPATAITNSYSLRWFGVVNGTPSSTATILRLKMSGTAATWDFIYNNSSSFVMNIYNNTGTLISSTTVTWDWGRSVQYQLDLSLSGSVITWTISQTLPHNIGFVGSSTITGYTLGYPSAIYFNYGQQINAMSVGHVTLFNSVVSIFLQNDAFNAWTGETPEVRFTRICLEENIRCTVYGSGTDASMGAQLINNTLTLLRECEIANAGIIYDSRHFVGLEFRTRDSMATYAGPVLTLDYTHADISEIKPTYDDLLIKNNVQITRQGGSNLTVQDTTSTRAVDKIGTYGDSLTINTASDVTLIDHGKWRLHLGTVDEYRYPTISMKMTRTNFARTNLGYNAQTIDIGDLLIVNNQPPWLPPYSIRQIVQGFTERLNSTDWDITPNLSPASPFDIGQYNDNGISRYDSQQSILTNNIGTSDTTISVTTISGAVWTTTSSMFPFDIVIDGEQITVTSINILISPQTFTVIRAINGVISTHSAGATVSLFHPVYYTLGD